MIHHAVYLSLPETADEADRAELAEVMKNLAALVDEIEGFTGFHHGPNIDIERKSPEASHGFHAVFTDRAALARYADDPRHRALGARLIALCGGADRIKVYDLEVAP